MSIYRHDGMGYVAIINLISSHIIYYDIDSKIVENGSRVVALYYFDLWYVLWHLRLDNLIEITWLIF